jgi:hypothetical protein
VARIRSIHPGLWTDEAFVCVSPLARLLFIGIWNECDDQGSFEWSPLKLKMRILPADNVDVNELLAELAGNGCILSYELDGRKLGAVRNFGKFQRPKKPNSIYPQTDEVRKWCATGSEPLPHHAATASEIRPQMEDGGDKMEDGGGKKKEGSRAKSASVEPYPFDGRIVRLSKADLENWQRTYHAIPDIPAELTSLDAWLTDQPAEKQRKWFHTVAGALNRKHQEILTERVKVDADPDEGWIP